MIDTDGMKKYIIYIAVIAVLAGTYVVLSGSKKENPTPSGSVSPTASSAVPSTSSKPSVSATPKPTGSLSPTPTPTYTITPTPTPSASSSPTPSISPTPTPTPTLIVNETKAYVVVIQSLAFNPTPLTVKKGDIVTFQNMDNFTHKIQARNLTFVSPNIAANQEWTLETANLNPGTYDYYSTTHPTATGSLIIE